MVGSTQRTVMCVQQARQAHAVAMSREQAQQLQGNQITCGTGCHRYMGNTKEQRQLEAFHS